MLQRFVLLLGHPVLLADRDAVLAAARHRRSARPGAGGSTTSARLRRTGASRIAAGRRRRRSLVIVVVTPLDHVGHSVLARRADRASRSAMLVPIGMLLGIPMPTGLRLLRARAPEMVAWAWGINGALSVLGATLAIFIAMNWGFQITLLAASATYLVGFAALRVATKPAPKAVSLNGVEALNVASRRRC